MLSKKRALLLLASLLLISFFLVSTANNISDDFIPHLIAKNPGTSNFVYYGKTDNVSSEMNQMVLLPEFEDYLQKTGVNKDNYELKLASSSSNEHPQAIIHISNQEFHYSLTNVTDNSNTGNSNGLKSNAAWNNFKIANQCGFTLGKIFVVYYHFEAGKDSTNVNGIRMKTRYDLVNGGVLNYDPSAEYNYVSIMVYKDKSQINPNTTKMHVPFGKWHTAYVRQDKNMYLQLV
ncbi:MAG: hypothetical protein PHY59_03920 [Methanobacterium sp.]|nr:hypothetical protein [Methanobacterium sp.]